MIAGATITCYIHQQPVHTRLCRTKNSSSSLVILVYTEKVNKLYSSHLNYGKFTKTLDNKLELYSTNYGSLILPLRGKAIVMAIV